MKPTFSSVAGGAEVTWLSPEDLTAAEHAYFFGRPDVVQKENTDIERSSRMMLPQEEQA